MASYKRKPTRPKRGTGNPSTLPPETPGSLPTGYRKPTADTRVDRRVGNQYQRNSATFGAGQNIKNPTLAERTTGRLNALGKEPKGVNVADGISRKEAQIVKLARRAQKAGKIGQRSYTRYKRAKAPKPPTSSSGSSY